MPKILIADDRPDLVQLLRDLLTVEGYQVVTAENGREALETIYQCAPDLVLLDLNMPVMDGYEVCHQIKTDPATADIPVLMLTAWADPEYRVKGLELGAEDYLAKPFNPALLHARIRGSLASLQEERVALLREQFAQVTAVQEEERKRIARELHDGLVPVLASLSIRLHTIAKRLDREQYPISGEIKELAEQAQASSRDIRRLIHDLRPVALDELGLVPALRQHLTDCEHEHGLAIDLIVDNEQRLAGPIETALFRIVQEAVNNVVRHAQAQHLSVRLTRGQDQVTLQVVDDGQGFETQLPRSGKHIGLWSMRERVEQLGGQFEVLSAPGQGTIVRAGIPL